MFEGDAEADDAAAKMERDVMMFMVVKLLVGVGCWFCVFSCVAAQGVVSKAKANDIYHNTVAPSRTSSVWRRPNNGFHRQAIQFPSAGGTQKITLESFPPKFDEKIATPCFQQINSPFNRYLYTNYCYSTIDATLHTFFLAPTISTHLCTAQLNCTICAFDSTILAAGLVTGIQWPIFVTVQIAS